MSRPASARITLDHWFNMKAGLGFDAAPSLLFAADLDLTYTLIHVPIGLPPGVSVADALRKLGSSFAKEMAHGFKPGIVGTGFTLAFDCSYDRDYRFYFTVKELAITLQPWIPYIQFGAGVAYGATSKTTWIHLPVHVHLVASLFRFGIDTHIDVQGGGRHFIALPVSLSLPVFNWISGYKKLPLLLSLQYAPEVPIGGGETNHKVIFAFALGPPMGLR